VSQVSAKDKRALALRKLHSFAGVFPLGLFLLLHLGMNGLALFSQDSFEAGVSAVVRVPALWLLELVAIWLPLSWHVLYGLKLALSRPRDHESAGVWKRRLKQAPGIITFAFLVYHLWQFRIQVALGSLKEADLYYELCKGLSSTTASGLPLPAAIYLLGLAAAVFHFTHGLYAFCSDLVSWPRLERPKPLAFGVFGALLFALGATTVIYFATGSRLLFVSR